MWASHGKSHLTIGYTIPGYPAIQHSDGIYPKPNPYAKSHYQSNSSTGRYWQDNTNNYNRDQNNNYNRDHNNNNYNRDNSVGRNTNTDSGTNYNNNSRENSVGRNNNNNNSDNNTRSQSYFDNVNKQNRSKFDIDADTICSAVIIPVLTEYLNVSVSLPKQMTTKTATSMLPNPLTSSKITEEGATANQEPAQTQEIEWQALLDSGSTAGNFIKTMICYYN
jgi:hypothetical protein